MHLGTHLFFSRSESASVPVGNGLAFPCKMGRVYGQADFRRMLSIERKRAQRSRGSFLLLLVRLKLVSGQAIDVPPGVAASLFSGLSLCLREVDFVGWHREGRVAGAVLAQGPVPRDVDVSPRIAERVTQALVRGLRARESMRLDVRLIRLGRGQE